MWLRIFKDLDSLGFLLQTGDFIFLRIFCLFFQAVKLLSLNLGLFQVAKFDLGNIFLPIVRKGSWHMMQNSLKCYQCFLLEFNYLSKSKPHDIPPQSGKGVVLWKSC